MNKQEIQTQIDEMKAKLAEDNRDDFIKAFKID